MSAREDAWDALAVIEYANTAAHIERTHLRTLMTEGMIAAAELPDAVKVKTARAAAMSNLKTLLRRIPIEKYEEEDGHFLSSMALWGSDEFNLDVTFGDKRAITHSVPGSREKNDHIVETSNSVAVNGIPYRPLADMDADYLTTATFFATQMRAMWMLELLPSSIRSIHVGYWELPPLLQGAGLANMLLSFLMYTAMFRVEWSALPYLSITDCSMATFRVVDTVFGMERPVRFDRVSPDRSPLFFYYPSLASSSISLRTGAMSTHGSLLINNVEWWSPAMRALRRRLEWLKPPELPSQARTAMYTFFLQRAQEQFAAYVGFGPLAHRPLLNAPQGYRVVSFTALTALTALAPDAYLAPFEGVSMRLEEPMELLSSGRVTEEQLQRLCASIVQQPLRRVAPFRDIRPYPQDPQDPLVLVVDVTRPAASQPLSEFRIFVMFCVDLARACGLLLCVNASDDMSAVIAKSKLHWYKSDTTDYRAGTADAVMALADSSVAVVNGSKRTPLWALPAGDWTTGPAPFFLRSPNSEQDYWFYPQPKPPSFVLPSALRAVRSQDQVQAMAGDHRPEAVASCTPAGGMPRTEQCPAPLAAVFAGAASKRTRPDDEEDKDDEKDATTKRARFQAAAVSCTHCARPWATFVARHGMHAFCDAQCQTDFHALV